jgi:hypothetical protein
LDHVIAAHSFDLKVSKRFPKTLNTFHKFWNKTKSNKKWFNTY